MTAVLKHFAASTKTIAEKAVERGVLTYPGICYISDTNTLAWLTLDNEIKYITGDNQITDIKYVGTNLVFYSGGKILFSYNTALSPEDEKAIIQEITNGLSLEEYIKSAEVSRLLDDIIGDLGDKNTVIDYVNSLSYHDLSNVPIIDLTGTFTNVINISSLNDGVYKIKGQFFIGGNCTTIQSSAADSFFLVSHGDNSSVTVTQLSGKSIQIFFIEADGSCVSDRYVTEKWISELDLVTAANVQEYVREIVTDTVVKIIDETLDERLDIALDKKIGGIVSEDIKNLFQKGE